MKRLNAVERLLIELGARVVSVNNIHPANGIYKGSTGTVIGFPPCSKQFLDHVTPAYNGNIKQVEIRRYSREFLKVHGRWKTMCSPSIETECKEG